MFVIVQHVAGRMVAAAATEYGVTGEAVLGKGRLGRVVMARTAVMAALRDAGFTLEEIGLALDRDHSTVHHALAKVERARLRVTDHDFMRALAACNTVAKSELGTETVQDFASRVKAVAEFAASVRGIARTLEAESRALEQQAMAFVSWREPVHVRAVAS